MVAVKFLSVNSGNLLRGLFVGMLVVSGTGITLLVQEGWVKIPQKRTERLLVEYKRHQQSVVHGHKGGVTKH